MAKTNITVEYWKVPFDRYDTLDNLLDSDFVKKNGILANSYKISHRNKFERLENEYWTKEDAAYPHIIYGIFDDLGQNRQEITTGTAGMLEDWNIARDAYELATYA